MHVHVQHIACKTVKTENRNAPSISSVAMDEVRALVVEEGAMSSEGAACGTAVLLAAAWAAAELVALAAALTLAVVAGVVAGDVGKKRMLGIPACSTPSIVSPSCVPSVSDVTSLPSLALAPVLLFVTIGFDIAE